MRANESARDNSRWRTHQDSHYCHRNTHHPKHPPIPILAAPTIAVRVAEYDHITRGFDAPTTGPKPVCAHHHDRSDSLLESRKGRFDSLLLLDLMLPVLVFDLPAVALVICFRWRWWRGARRPGGVGTAPTWRRFCSRLWGRRTTCQVCQLLEALHCIKFARAGFVARELHGQFTLTDLHGREVVAKVKGKPPSVQTSRLVFAQQLHVCPAITARPGCVGAVRHRVKGPGEGGGGALELDVGVHLPELRELLGHPFLVRDVRDAYADGHIEPLRGTLGLARVSLRLARMPKLG